MKTTYGKDYSIESDGVAVWVNRPCGLIGRFGQLGIDVHGEEGQECLYCTHARTGPTDWPVFVAKMKEHHRVSIPEKHRPTRCKLP